MAGKKIGIWGLGVVGSSALRYFGTQGYEIGVMEHRVLTDNEKALLRNYGARFFSESEKSLFFETYQSILPSTGIDLRPYQQQPQEWLSELDIFYGVNRVPIIGITGSIGKTSVTHILSDVLRALCLNVATGGNIGVGLLDMLDPKKDFTILEVSSFQLERAKVFAPHLAIITNIYPNHLDRHTTFENYRLTKYALLGRQKPGDSALIPEYLGDMVREHKPKGRIAFFSPERPESCGTFSVPYYYFGRHGQQIIREQAGEITILTETIPDCSYPANWLVIAAALDLLGIQPHALPLTGVPTIPDHRLQHIGTYREIDFYDDSKSTVPQATQAAFQKLSSRPIIGLIGGISKGVDRTQFVAGLKPLVKHIVCFGAEADILHSIATKTGISSSSHTTLDEAFSDALSQAVPGDQIVLSPAGASFDLFANYQERGKAFQRCFQKLHESGS